MGLDTTHDAWHGAYSAFARWRNEIAEALGIPMVATSWGGVTYELPDDLPVDDSLLGDWHGEPPDPIYYLLAHSDCEGHIEPVHAAQLADRLEEVLLLVPDHDAGGHIGMFHEKTQRFIAGCRAAAASGERIEFW